MKKYQAITMQNVIYGHSPPCRLTAVKNEFQIMGLHGLKGTTELEHIGNGFFKLIVLINYHYTLLPFQLPSALLHIHYFLYIIFLVSFLANILKLAWKTKVACGGGHILKRLFLGAQFQLKISSSDVYS